MDLKLRGRRALVTGGTRGLGRGIVARLVEEGCAVSLCARDADAVETAVAELGAAHGAAVDVTDDGELRRYVDEAAERLGGLDLVVANAGGSAGSASFADAEGDDWRATFGLNAVHAAVVVRAALPHLRASDAAIEISAALAAA